MTDTPTGLSRYPDTVMEHAHNPTRQGIRSRRLSFCLFQHAPGGVDVQDLRPLRGRPCGPIPDTDAYPGAPTDTQKKIKSTKERG